MLCKYVILSLDFECLFANPQTPPFAEYRVFNLCIVIQYVYILSEDIRIKRKAVAHDVEGDDQNSITTVPNIAFNDLCSTCHIIISSLMSILPT